MPCALLELDAIPAERGHEAKRSDRDDAIGALRGLPPAEDPTLRECLELVAGREDSIAEPGAILSPIGLVQIEAVLVELNTELVAPGVRFAGERASVDDVRCTVGRPAHEGEGLADDGRTGAEFFDKLHHGV